MLTTIYKLTRCRKVNRLSTRNTKYKLVASLNNRPTQFFVWLQLRNILRYHTYWLIIVYVAFLMGCSKYEGVIGDRIQSVAKESYRVKLSLHHIYLSSTNNDVDVRLAFSSKKLAEISTLTLDKLTE